jgi:hypothetical protein
MIGVPPVSRPIRRQGDFRGQAKWQASAESRSWAGLVTGWKSTLRCPAVRPGLLEGVRLAVRRKVFKAGFWW